MLSAERCDSDTPACSATSRSERPRSRRARRMHAPSASRNSIQSGCHAPNLNPGALSRLARSVSEAHALRNGLTDGEVTLAIGEISTRHRCPSPTLCGGARPDSAVADRPRQQTYPSRLGRRAPPRTAPGPATQAQPPTGAPHRRPLLDRSLEIGELFTVPRNRLPRPPASRPHR